MQHLILILVLDVRHDILTNAICVNQLYEDWQSFIMVLAVSAPDFQEQLKSNYVRYCPQTKTVSYHWAAARAAFNILQQSHNQ